MSTETAPEKPTLPPSARAKYTDYTFQSKSGTELSIRLWEAELAAADADDSPPAPWVLHTHGGGFLAGHHYTPPWWLHDGFRRRGYHLLSHSYRLGPQASLDDQLADCLEVVAWCRATLPSLLGAGRVDAGRYVLVGDSAGGLLVTLMACHLREEPRPRAVIDVYGVTDFHDMLRIDRDVNGDAAVPWKGEFTADELEAFLDDRNPANILTVAMAWDEQDRFTEVELGEIWGVEVEYSARIRRHAELNIWRQTRPNSSALTIRGIMHPERFGTKAELDDYLRSVSPLQVLRQRLSHGVTGDYPPTAFLHGTGDVAVPVRQSQEMAEALRQVGVPVVECYEEGQPHVWDRKYTVGLSCLKVLPAPLANLRVVLIIGSVGSRVGQIHTANYRFR